MIKLNIRNLRLADFVHNFNKTRQRFSDVILQEGGRSYRYSDASQKITSELAEVNLSKRLRFVKGKTRGLIITHDLNILFTV